MQQLQIDGTHISDFAKLKYVHVTIDTFSGFLVAAAFTEEATKKPEKVSIVTCTHFKFLKSEI